MSTADLKIDLISQITSITDKVRLKELMQILKFESESAVYVTNNDEKEAVSVARNQIKNGESITHKDFQKDLQEWLKK
ncbi:hypothetical protein EIH07_04240 [Chryseobacterium taklimakanense]|jgi:hypothetical protein|uniref:hypothetical protein n=1 Tax=Chryseobacterium taklimakanense TaxID=536441 RepID=UPI000F5D998B|nr:hypothetical protein [Chryseobacterium taklimakanense]AZI22310.1 hypothetical protein EIH07_04240 [Chryseobacterium taklimakanense]